MAAGKAKYLCVEVDDVDLGDATERTLVSDDLAFGEVGDSQKIYETSGNVTAIEFFRGLTQTEPNRKARVDIFYTGDTPTSEVWLYYDDDGATVKRTITLTHSWSGAALSKTEESVA